jgi:hypothetical protein
MANTVAAALQLVMILTFQALELALHVPNDTTILHDTQQEP